MPRKPRAKPGPPEGGRVRHATAADLPRIVELWRGITDAHAVFGAAFATRRGGEACVEALLRRTLDDPQSALFVWEDGRRGLLGLCIVRVQIAPALLAEPGRGEITDLGVEERARRRGIGSALAEAALSWVTRRGVPRVEVRVAARNRVGQAFWRGLGFEDFVDVLDRQL
jgi:ribosomal protein S18 acetylase RimI-like enzyme